MFLKNCGAIFQKHAPLKIFTAAAGGEQNDVQTSHKKLLVFLCALCASVLKNVQ
jgi:hypothetical protein